MGKCLNQGDDFLIGHITFEAAHDFCRLHRPVALLQNAAGGWDGFRVPDHVVALAWLRELDFLPAVTSANRSGAPAALTAQAAWAALEPHVALALDAGPVKTGAASTVVKVAAGGIEILRAGPVGRAALARAAGCPVRG